VTVSISLYTHVEMSATVYIGFTDLDFKWSRDFTGSTQATLETYVDTDERIRFKVTQPPDIAIQMSEHKNDLGGAAEKFLGALEQIARRNFDPVQETLGNRARDVVASFRQHADDLKQLGVQSSHAHFISPTGQVFLLDNPSYDGELNLRMDVTYSV
jgi:hypothetical protein